MRPGRSSRRRGRVDLPARARASSALFEAAGLPTSTETALSVSVEHPTSRSGGSRSRSASGRRAPTSRDSTRSTGRRCASNAAPCFRRRRSCSPRGPGRHSAARRLERLLVEDRVVRERVVEHGTAAVNPPRSYTRQAASWTWPVSSTSCVSPSSRARGLDQRQNVAADVLVHPMRGQGVHPLHLADPVAVAPQRTARDRGAFVAGDPDRRVRVGHLLDRQVGAELRWGDSSRCAFSAAISSRTSSWRGLSTAIVTAIGGILSRRDQARAARLLDDLDARHLREETRVLDDVVPRHPGAAQRLRPAEPLRSHPRSSTRSSVAPESVASRNSQRSNSTSLSVAP